MMYVKRCSSERHQSPSRDDDHVRIDDPPITRIPPPAPAPCLHPSPRARGHALMDVHPHMSPIPTRDAAPESRPLCHPCAPSPLFTHANTLAVPRQLGSGPPSPPPPPLDSPSARPGMAPRPHSCSAAAPHELAFASTGGRSGLLDELDDATGVSSALDFFLFLRLYLTLIGPFGPTTMSS